MQCQVHHQSKFLVQTTHLQNKLQLQNKSQIQNQQSSVQRWSASSFYLHLKNKIHEKIQTTSNQNTKINNRQYQLKQAPHKLKQKTIYSNLQIILDPMCSKLQHQRAQLSHAVYKKVLTNRCPIKSKYPIKIQRNLSAKVLSQKVQTHSQAKLACTRNSQLEKKEAQNKKGEGQKKQSLNIIQNQKHCLQKNQNFSMNDIIKLKKANSLILKKSLSREIVKVKNFDTEALIFYFKAKNTVNVFNRQLSIKKIRSSKNIKKIVTIM